jgi:hypothetical protein
VTDGGGGGVMVLMVVVVVMMVVVISSTISDCTEILQGFLDNSVFHVFTRGHHIVNLNVTATLLYKILTNISAYEFFRMSLRLLNAAGFRL